MSTLADHMARKSWKPSSLSEDEPFITGCRLGFKDDISYTALPRKFLQEVCAAIMQLHVSHGQVTQISDRFNGFNVAIENLTKVVSDQGKELSVLKEQVAQINLKFQDTSGISSENRALKNNMHQLEAKIEIMEAKQNSIVEQLEKTGDEITIPSVP